MKVFFLMKDSVFTVSGNEVIADSKNYHFDSCFMGSDNLILYQTAVKASVLNTLNGIDSTVFCYGQTNSGKTYSMMGCDAQPGILPQSVNDIFDSIRHDFHREFLIRVSYMELYNETIYDLLNPTQKDLRIFDHKTNRVHVSQLKEEVVTSAQHVMRLVAKGESNRSSFPTENNETSSRSHTIFQMTIESRLNTPNSSINVAQLNLIDLAGSEKASLDQSRRKESAFINKSLLTLGTVISQLTEDTPQHVSFRDSKLTRLLRYSLQGNSQLALIATINPMEKFLDESLSTLAFASRVSNIVPKPVVHQSLDEMSLIKKYKIEIEDLKARLQETNEKLQSELSNKSESLIDESVVLRKADISGKIDSLSKLILSSNNLNSKPLLDWQASVRDYQQGSVILQEGYLPQASGSLRQELLKQKLDKHSLQKIHYLSMPALNQDVELKQAVGEEHLLLSSKSSKLQTEMEIVINEQAKQIEELQMKLDASDKSLIELKQAVKEEDVLLRTKVYNDSKVYKEMEIVINQQAKQIEELQKKLDATDKSFKISKASLDIVVKLLERAVHGMPEEALQLSGWTKCLEELIEVQKESH